jgi:quercetin dioxygenase-like cupin family protein
MTPAQVLQAWGKRHGVCRTCVDRTWYFNYRPFTPEGAGAVFRRGRVVHVFTVWKPEGWSTPEGLMLGQQAGEIGATYHLEDTQEGFLVLAGECLLIVEGEERQLRAWDFVHCPPGTAHTFVGAGDGPCVVVGVGARRKGRGIIYPVNETASKHGAGVDEETSDPRVAYAHV